MKSAPIQSQIKTILFRLWIPISRLTTITTFIKVPKKPIFMSRNQTAMNSMVGVGQGNLHTLTSQNQKLENGNYYYFLTKFYGILGGQSNSNSKIKLRGRKLNLHKIYCVVKCDSCHRTLKQRYKLVLTII